MPRPKTKTELLELSQSNFKKLIDLLGSIDDQFKEGDFKLKGLNRNCRDVVAHLHHWHMMLIGWNQAGLKGEKPEMPAKGYTWKSLPDLNLEIWKMYNNCTYKSVYKKLHNSYNDVQAIIHSYSNDDLFEKKKFKWTGSTSLAAYLISASSSHYDWAYKYIKKQTKN